jgi:hypothetical protein
MKAIATALVVGSLVVGLAGPLSAPAAVQRPAAGPQAAPAAAAQQKAEPFDLEKERAKAAGTFLKLKDGRERRDPFENPLKALAAAPTPTQGLPQEEQEKLVTEAERELGLYQAALRQGEVPSANAHLSRLMEIVGQADKFTIPELRQRLDAVRTGLGGSAVLADRKFIDITDAFDKGDYERVAALYGDLSKFVGALPKEEQAKLTGRLSEVQKVAQRAAARLAFSKLSISITGVVISDAGSYTTVNGLVLGVGDLVRKETGKGGRVSPLAMSEPLEPPVKVAEVRLSEVIFDFQGERLSREVGRRYLVEQRAARGAAPGAKAPRR